MTVDAIQLTTEALKALLETALGPGEIFVGPPAEQAAAAASASLFLYHLVPNAELRNEPHLDGLRSGGPGNAGERNSIPFDLRYLITVFRPTTPDGGGSPVELLRLGQIIQTLHATPVLTGARLPGQTARLTPDPVSMEEISRVWSLFPETSYRTSVIYLATPVFVDAAEALAGPRVREVHRHGGRLQATGGALMARYEIVRFDDPPRVDRVAFAIAPIDHFTGGIVRGPVTAEIEALGVRARRNLSGMLVFVNLEQRERYWVAIKAEDAGYFDLRREIERPDDDAPDADRLETIELHPLPTAAFTHETTLVRGVVQLEGAAVAGVVVEAVERDLDPATRPVFEGRSDRRGAFVVPLRLHPSNASPDSQPSAVFLFTFKHEEVPDRELQGKVVDGTAYRFTLPIELRDPIVSPLLVAGGN